MTFPWPLFSLDDTQDEGGQRRQGDHGVAGLVQLGDLEAVAQVPGEVPGIEDCEGGEEVEEEECEGGEEVGEKECEEGDEPEAVEEVEHDGEGQDKLGAEDEGPAEVQVLQSSLCLEYGV